MENLSEKELRIFETPIEKFKVHLQIPNNNRIIFSGRFGHGKTTFLRHFFAASTQQKLFNNIDYNVISIFPVNYSISSNEDILKYIKYDILYEMLRNNYQVNSINLDYLDTLPFYLKEQPLKMLASLIRIIPVIGKDFSEGIEHIDTLKKHFIDFHNKKKTEASDGDQLIEYIDELETKEGSLYEDNTISKLIETIITNEKKLNNAKETILLIDDLDRIDPEHIFRILNVFAAHFDRSDFKQNKFGFNKIVLVCDIDNIRSIFKSRYGLATDFNGYIDKFYSTRIFNYDIRGDIFSFFKSIISDAYYSHNEYSVTKDEKVRQDYFNEFFKSPLVLELISLLVDNNEIDLRNVVKWKELTIIVHPTIKISNHTLILYDYKLLFTIMFLSDVKGGLLSLKDSLLRSKYVGKISDISEYFKEILYILLLSSHKQNHTHEYSLGDYKIKSGKTINIYIKPSTKTSKKYTVEISSPKYNGANGAFLDENDAIDLICDLIDLLISSKI